MRLVDTLKYVAYLARGKKPFTTGYTIYKERAIARVLATGDFELGHHGPRYGERLDERIVEYPWLFSRIPAGTGRLLDAGSVLNFEYLHFHPGPRRDASAGSAHRLLRVRRPARDLLP
jgi:hypothetical protein